MRVLPRRRPKPRHRATPHRHTWVAGPHYTGTGWQILRCPCGATELA